MRQYPMPRSTNRVVLVALSLCALLSAAAAARGEFQPPADGVVTDKQAAAYTQAFGEWLDVLRATGKQVDQNQASALAALAAVDGRFKAVLVKAGLSQEEFDWVGEKVWEARGAVMMEGVVTTAKGQLTAGLKQNDDQQAAVKARIAGFEATEESKKQNAEALAAAKEELKALVEVRASFEQTLSEMDKQVAEATAKCPKQNLDLARKYGPALDSAVTKK